jgi:SAM-dependent methyltransferase
MDTERIHEAVREGYSRVAEQGCGCGCSCGADAAEISSRIGYTEEEMESVPGGANLGLGCGNPVALAGIGQGETVLDLGSGAGFDAFIAARAVGESGRVIGVDMTPAMLARARENARAGGYGNVEFRLGEIEHLPVADGSVDAVISNCVINLSPEKGQVFVEAFRVLKPGGRLLVSDIAMAGELPERVRQSIAAYVGCIAGAVSRERYLDLIRRAGFADVEIVEEASFPVSCMANDPTAQAVVGDLALTPEELRATESAIASVRVRAVRPA